MDALIINQSLCHRAPPSQINSLKLSALLMCHFWHQINQLAETKVVLLSKRLFCFK